MSNKIEKIKGDRIIWTIVSVLAIFSFLPVYSASSNFGNDLIFSNMIKHVAIVFIGILIMYFTHLVPYKYFKGLSILALPIIIILLIYTAFQGNIIEGANANRWIQLPVLGLSFQPSSMAIVVIMVYSAFYLSKNYEKKIKFAHSILPLWLPISIIILLILPSNFSTALMIFFMVLTLIFIGRYPIKYLLGIFFTGLFCLTLFVLLTKSFP